MCIIETCHDCEDHRRTPRGGRGGNGWKLSADVGRRVIDGCKGAKILIWYIYIYIHIYISDNGNIMAIFRGVLQCIGIQYAVSRICASINTYEIHWNWNTSFEVHESPARPAVWMKTEGCQSFALYMRQSSKASSGLLMIHALPELLYQARFTLNPVVNISKPYGVVELGVIINAKKWGVYLWAGIFWANLLMIHCREEASCQNQDVA